MSCKNFMYWFYTHLPNKINSRLQAPTKYNGPLCMHIWLHLAYKTEQKKMQFSCLLNPIPICLFRHIFKLSIKREFYFFIFLQKTNMADLTSQIRYILLWWFYRRKDTMAFFFHDRHARLRALHYPIILFTYFTSPHLNTDSFVHIFFRKKCRFS